MKRKLCFIFTEMIIVTLLACSCSSGQETKQAAENISEDTADASPETVMPEQPEYEADDDETDAVEPDYIKTDDIEAGDIETADGKTDNTADEVIAPDLNRNGIAEPVSPGEVDALPITEPLEMAFYSGAGAWATFLTLNPDGSFVGDYDDADGGTSYVCQFHGRFGKMEKLTGSSYLLTLSELEIDTGHAEGESWTESGDDRQYIASQPYGFDDNDYNTLEPGARFILYSPDATGHEPETELYGALEFRSWMHERHEFNSADDILGCWGLQSIETGRGFFDN